MSQQSLGICVHVSPEYLQEDTGMTKCEMRMALFIARAVIIKCTFTTRSLTDEE